MVCGLTQFLGLLNCYPHFIPRAALVLHPLHSACKGFLPSSQMLWDAAVDTSATAKDALASACQLIHPWADAHLALRTDASDIGTGALLEESLESGTLCLSSTGP